MRNAQRYVRRRHDQRQPEQQPAAVELMPQDNPLPEQEMMPNAGPVPEIEPIPQIRPEPQPDVNDSPTFRARMRFPMQGYSRAPFNTRVCIFSICENRNLTRISK